MTFLKSGMNIRFRASFFSMFVSASFAPAFAGGKGHKAHEHGVAQINIVGEGNTVTVQLESPSDAIYGFEHEAKKPADIKKRDQAIEKLKTNADKMFILDSALACQLKSSDIKPFVSEQSSDDSDKKKKGTHSEVHAVFKFECTKPVSGSGVKFSTTPFFKSLRQLNVQVLSGDKQSGTTIKNDKGSVSL